MKLHPAPTAVVALLLARGAKKDEVDGVVKIMTDFPDKAYLTYEEEIDDIDRAIEMFRKQRIRALTGKRG